MRTYTKVLTAVTAVGLAATMTACSSDKDTKAVGSFSKLTGNTTSVALDSGFVSALGQLGLKPGVVGGATLTGTTVSFKITGGKATIYKKGAVTPYVQGVVDHSGGLTLTAGGKTVTLENFVINPGNDSNLTGDVLLNGKMAAPAGTKLFDLDGSTLKTPTISSDGVATLTGTTVKLSDGAAMLLDSTFGTDKVKGGLVIGIATIKATGTA